MLESNTLLESGQASTKKINELEKCLSEKKALMGQLELDFNTAKEVVAQC